jgi:HSP20 family protein
MALIRRRENHDSGMTRPAWNPFETMYEMMRWDPFQSLGGLASGTWGSFTPSFDVKETADAFLLKADMPGVKEEDLEVSLAGNQLTISGERKEERRAEDEKRHIYECSYGSFTRTLGLPDGVDADQIEAELKNGVLSVRLPKKPEARPRRIRLFGRKSEKNEA